MSIGTSELLARQARFAARLEEMKLAGAVVVSRGGGTFDRHGDVFYLTGHYQPFVYLPENPPRWSGRSHTVLVLRADGRAVLCVSVPDEHGHGPLAADEIRAGGDFVEVVIGAVREQGLDGRELGIVGLDVLPGDLWDRLRSGLPDAAFTRVEEALAALRRIKSGAEQAAIRAAAGMGRRAVSAFLAALRPGVTEAEAVAEAIAEVARSGGGVYLPAASSGPMTWSYTTDPVAGFGTRRLEEGELARFDLVAVLDGYLTDFGRTVVVGEASEGQRRLLDSLHRGLDAAIGAIRPGVAVREVVEAGDAALVEAGVSLEPRPEADLVAAYPPHWGHGLGLGWERPWFVDSEELVVEAGMYLAIERAVRMPGVGTAAAEQNLLVSDVGVELLTGGPEGTWT